jgi:Peptidase propeptide and YPEB domain
MSANSGTAGVARPQAVHRPFRLLRWTRRLPGVVYAAAALGAGVVGAAPPQGPVMPVESRAEPELSRAQAMALVQKHYGARVVRTDIADQAGRRLYVFRLLSSGGKVWIVRVDARSGTEVP